MIVYDVAVNAPIFNTLSYTHPNTNRSVHQVGHALLVPLGHRKVTGYIVDVREQEDNESVDGFVLKPVGRLLSPAPLFSQEMLPLYRWLAQYYLYPIGEVLSTALPGTPSAKSGIKAQLVAGAEEQLVSYIDQLEVGETLEVLQSLLAQKQLRPNALRKLRKSAQGSSLIKQLEKTQVITLSSDIYQSQSLERYEVVYSPHPCLLENFEPGQEVAELVQQCFAGTAELSLLPSERKTLDILLTLCRKQSTSEISRKEILKEYKYCSKYLSYLGEKGVIEQGKTRLYRTPLTDMQPQETEVKQHTEEQQNALDVLLPKIASEEFSPFLLHGVTGSGKTEVYIQAVRQALQQGKTALVLVPEIALATQLEEQFHAHFGSQLSLLHSGLSDGERFDQWQQLCNGDSKVVLGARSAVFAPLTDLGVILVDEEHEGAYKQDDGLRYNGRDVAVMRAKIAQCPVVLGSATPSVTSFSNCSNGKYRLLSMTRRVSNRPLPSVQVVDMGKGKRSRPDLFFSDQLIQAMNATLEKKSRFSSLSTEEDSPQV